MKKLISVLLACLMLVSLCACNPLERFISPENSEEKGTSGITEETLIDELQGWWVGEISDGLAYLMHFNGDRFTDGQYPGSYSVTGSVVKVTELGVDEFEIQIHFPEGTVDGETIAEHDDTITVKSDDGFQKTVTVTTPDGSVYECEYAGITDVERLEKCTKLTGF